METTLLFKTRICQLFIKLAVLPILLTDAFGQNAVFTEHTLFASGQNGYHTYRIPAIIKSKNGDLLAFCEARKNSSADSGDIDIVLRKSSDNGQTWSPMKLVQEEGGAAPITIGNPAPVVDEISGRLFLFFCRNNDRVFYIFSDDHGNTWSTRTEVTSNVKLPTWGWYATGPGHGIQIRRGSQAGRLVIPCDHRVGLPGVDDGAPGTHVVYSDDQGLTWRLGAVASVTSEVYPNENLCVELVTPTANGGSHLYFNARKLGAAGTAPGSRVDTTSTDGGLTYSRPYAPRLDLVCPLFNSGVQGSLQRLRGNEDGSATNRILFSCPNDPAYRVRLSIWSSTDETLSWSAPKPVYLGPSAYSDMARTNQGEIALLYERGNTSPYETITFTRFNEAWLDAPYSTPPDGVPRPALWNFEEKPPGQFADTIQGAIRDVHSSGYKLNLSSQRPFPYVAGSPGYGNGTAMALDGSGGLQISDAESLNHFDYSGTSSFTIEAVFRIPLGSTQTGALVAKDLDSKLPSWWLRVNNGRMQFLVSDYGRQAFLQATNLVNDGQWHHVAAVRDAGNPLNKVLRLYLDGTLIGSAPDTTQGTLANAEPLRIGHFGRYVTRNLTGDIDVVRITPEALALSQFLKSHTQFVGKIAVSQIGQLVDGESMISFGFANAETQGETKTFTIGNPGGSDLTGLRATISGTDQSDFSVGTLSQTGIAAGTNDTATFTVTFSPGQGPTLRTALLQISSNETNAQESFDIQLNGTVNSPPKNILLSLVNTQDGLPAGATIGTLATSDPDNTNGFSYSLVQGGGDTDNAHFTIFGDSLKTSSGTDFKTKSGYTIRIRTTDPFGLFFEKPLTINITNGAASYAEWAANNGLSGSGSLPNSIPFGDSVPNLLKYAFNMDGSRPDSSVLAANGTSGLPRVELGANVGQSVFRIEYLRRKGSGLIYTLQCSENLNHFDLFQGSESVTPITAYWERVMVSVPFAESTEPQLFFRVKVQNP